jgi:hypothetical protein
MVLHIHGAVVNGPFLRFCLGAGWFTVCGWGALLWFCMCVLCGQGALIVLWVLAFALGSVVLLRGAPVPAMAHRAIVH